MKFKYFLRGFGIGIVFASVICLVAFLDSDANVISEKEIIERAKELGMVEKEDSIEDMFSDKNNSKEVTESESIRQEISESDTEEQDTESQDVTTDNNTAEATENTTEANTTESTTETTENITEQQEITVTLTIEPGSSSFPVCQKLQDLGMIEDAQDFDSYLIQYGYAHRISVGTHTLTIGMSYEEIATIISDPM